MDQSYNDFLKMVLPEANCDYFELTGYKKDPEREVMDLYLQEIITVPAEFSNARLTSKGFFLTCPNQKYFALYSINLSN